MSDGIHIELEVLEFLGAVVDNEMDALATVETLAALMPPEMIEGMRELSREHIAQAQAEIDELIAEDTTWRPA
jgi:acetyl-CoA carboxylase carboxyltransferase component